jgi:DNA-binding response OmpR family regulator/nitrogen-specific signal transduction histidine kinase
MLLIVASAKFVRYRQQMQQELKLSKLEKEHADEIFRTKQQFFTNISHEFRTPLTLILPPIQEILRSNELTEKDTKLLVLANRNALRLSKLVNQLLDFAKIESSKLALRRSQVELVAFCNQVFGSFADLAKRNEINYRFECEMAVLYTSLDLEKIETVLFNVLSNAFKYTPYNGEISFKLSQFEEQDLPYIRIEICDNGMGIEPADQQKIFDRFYQTTASKAMNVGSGIGLTLSMEYVRLHGGDINLESVPEAGSCFGITLPFVAASAPKTDDLHPPAVRADTEGSKPATEVNPGKKLLLIVDDNTDILDFIELNLGDYYRFIRATDGRKGLEKCRKHLPDLIISDIMMPEMDGIALCKELKKTPATAHIPVILLTAKSLEVQKAEGLDSGADMYIIKPFDIDFLKSSVASVFRRNTLMYNFVKTEMSLVPGKSIDPEKNQDAVFLKRIIDIIEENIDNSELSVEFISEKYGISTTHLYRKMKQITNKSTVEVVKNYRMQRAAQLISNNEGNISEIMYAVGFSSPSSFSKAFKSVFGVSPAQYAELPADSA